MRRWLNRHFRVFLSSTFDDLKFERRFVLNRLRAMGFSATCMEEHCREGFDWRRWSTNQASKCDVYICLLGERAGAPADAFFNRKVFESITRLERSHSYDSATTHLLYKLERPFPDQAMLFSIEEEPEYREALVREDNYRSHEQRQGAETERELREGLSIRSVSELDQRLSNDLRISPVKFALGRLRTFRRSYFNNNGCSWRHAFEDESLDEATHRLGFSWRLRRPAILLSLLWIAFAASIFSPLEAALATVVLLAFLAMLALAYAPTFARAGTKTIIARGIFGLRIVQRPIDTDFVLQPLWEFFERRTGIGALRVVFADGASIFVPLVNSPGEFAHSVEARRNKLRRKTTRRS